MPVLDFHMAIWKAVTDKPTQNKIYTHHKNRNMYIPTFFKRHPLQTMTVSDVIVGAL